ncbi:MAG: glycosyltransferase family 9 protein [Myxococcota bacterium]
MEKILVIRLSSIGDILQASAVPRVLRKRFPHAEIHWVVRSDNLQLIQHNPHLSRVFSYDRNTGFAGLRALTRELQAQKYTHVYDAHSNLRSHWFSLFLRPKHFIRRGKQRWKRWLLFLLRINLFRGFNPVRSFIAPLAPWGVTDDGQGSEIHLPTAVTTKVRERINAFAGGAECIAMAPSAAWPKKRWPLEHWSELIRRILRDTAYRVVVLGGPQDGFCAELEAIDPTRVLNLQGKLSLLESAAAAQACRTLVAADTGLLHMAEALGKDVVEMIGPTPFGYPTRPGSVVLEVPLWCRPCTKDGGGPCVNPVYQRCMHDITPTRVFESLKILQGPG